MTRLWTTQGREIALAKLAERRAENAKRERIDNSKLYAGSPVYLDCIACGDPIAHPETYLFRTELCAQCSALHSLGWLND